MNIRKICTYLGVIGSFIFVFIGIAVLWAAVTCESSWLSLLLVGLIALAIGAKWLTMTIKERKEFFNPLWD